MFTQLADLAAEIGVMPMTLETAARDLGIPVLYIGPIALDHGATVAESVAGDGGADTASLVTATGSHNTNVTPRATRTA